MVAFRLLSEDPSLLVFLASGFETNVTALHVNRKGNSAHNRGAPLRPSACDAISR